MSITLRANIAIVTAMNNVVDVVVVPRGWRIYRRSSMRRQRCNISAKVQQPSTSTTTTTSTTTATIIGTGGSFLGGI
jgi:hypothetical protein